MSLYDSIQLNKKLPVHSNYNSSCQKQEFWEEAVEVSEDYWDTLDANGNKALKQFTCEDKQDYRWRKEVSSPKNFMGSILNKYVSTAFKEKAIRKDNDFYLDVDTLGSNINEFFEMATRAALIDGVSYILPDSTAQDVNLSEAQKQTLGIRPFLRFIEAESVPNWVDYLGHLQEAIVEFEDAEGNTYYLYYDTVSYARIDVDKKNVVTAKSELIPHGYTTIPLTRIMPFDTDESFVSAGATLQLSINNLSSLEKVELYKATFTKYFGAGITLATDPEGNPIPLNWGTERIMTAPNADAKMQVLGADVGQAESIRTSIKEEKENLYKQYHLGGQAVQEQGQAPSGYSIVISRADFNSICNQIVKATEQAENKIALLLNETENIGLENAQYSRSFIELDRNEAILQLRDILELKIPEELKQMEIEKFKQQFFTPKD